jgi:endonuclease/exonuclease/phosphatase (EEP) superfamily protein YafD
MIVLAIAGMTTLAFVAEYWWFLDYFCHFRLQYVYFLCLALVVFSLTRRFGRVIVCLLFLVVNLATIIPFYTATVPSTNAKKRLRLVSANVSANNTQREHIVDFVRKADPDFVILIEADKDWGDTVDALAADYPFEVREMNSGNFSKVLLSRYPLGPTRRKRFGRVSIYALLTECDVDGRRFQLIASHLLPPYRKSYFRQRNEHLSNLIDEVIAHQGTTIMAGDLNLTPWSPHFQSALERGGLVDSRLGFGIQPTWPSFLPGMRIPIDHVLVTPDVTIHGWQRGPFTGSDHLPLLVEFSLEETD